MKLLPIVGVLLLLHIVSRADVSLPKLISDGMVLQRDTKVNIWGWASPGEKITVRFNGKSYKATATAAGDWKIILAPTKAGGPFTMEIKGNNSIVLQNILAGDVWFCSGQSNMVITMERVKEKYPDDVSNASYPQIRNFLVPTYSDVASIHKDLPQGKWVAASNETILGFGAVSYFFAKKLHLKYNVPIGIINASVGGSPAQAWISEDGLRELPEFSERIRQFKDTAFMREAMRPIPPNVIDMPPDKGLSETPKWYDTAYVTKGWRDFWLPGFWEDQGIRNLDGVVWFRKEIQVPASMAGKPAKLFMGRIIDADEVYVNGTKIGNITYQYPPRRYPFASGVLKAGKNFIVVRVTNQNGKGGFAPDKPYYLTANDEKIDLRGAWKYKVGQVFPPVERSGPPPFSAQNSPTGLYNTMVAPLISYTIKAFNWYQGETNTGEPGNYSKIMSALIADWRKKWNQGELPFTFVQLPGFMEVQYSPSESNWAALRNEQRITLSVPLTAMVVAIDLGEWNDLHPLNKKDVGERMALAAEHNIYGDTKVVHSGPLYASSQVVESRVALTFSSMGGGLVARDDEELHYFEVAGVDRKFVWATARIEGDKVIVWSDQVKTPVYVRYAWADNPESANLYNKEGLPASPFEANVK